MKLPLIQIQDPMTFPTFDAMELLLDDRSVSVGDYLLDKKGFVKYAKKSRGNL